MKKVYKKIGPYIYALNPDGSIANTLNPQLPEHVIVYLIKDIEESIEIADEEINAISDMNKKTHWVDYRSTLINIVEILDNGMSPDEALITVLTSAKDSNVRYIVSDIEFKLEFASGIAEAYRESIQKLVLRLEKSAMFTDFRFSGQVKKLFESSPFCYDNVMSSMDNDFDKLILATNEHGGDTNKLARKSYTDIALGQELYWV